MNDASGYSAVGGFDMHITASCKAVVPSGHGSCRRRLAEIRDQGLKVVGQLRMFIEYCLEPALPSTHRNRLFQLLSLHSGARPIQLFPLALRALLIAATEPTRH